MNIVEDFFESREIYVCNEDKENKLNYNNITKDDVISYVNLLVEFQKKVSNPKGIILLNISSSIGSLYESYKVYLKKFEKNYNDIKKLKQKNIFFNEVSKYGDLIIKIAKESINSINYNDYILLLKRSMKNNEICLGSCDLTNLYFQNKLFVRDLKNISFNLRENDILNLISRLCKKRVNINSEDIIDYYLEKMNFKYESKSYILSMMQFPIQTLKIFDRKLNCKKKWSDEEATSKFVYSIEKLNI